MKKIVNLFDDVIDMILDSKLVTSVIKFSKL